MRMPSFITPKKRLNAAAARRSRTLGLPEEMDYEQMAEPNMKLSRALLIVLLLHIVAVGGIIAFNTIKTREDLASPNESAAAATASAPATATSANELPNDTASAIASPAIKVAEKSGAPEKTSAKRNGVVDSGKIYVVMKGDNPVKIAHRFKVSEADLLALNQISDSRKLQINQKLHIPKSTVNNPQKHSSD
jgi:LysM repeat protein